MQSINCMNDEELQELIEKCHKELISYPPGCPERKKILIQIGQLNERRRKKESCPQKQK